MPQEAGLRSIALTKARRYKIPPRLFLSLITVESSWNPRAVSKAGAIGLGQLMPATARELGVDPWDPEQNLEGAARYLAQQKRRFGTWRLALAAYNAGPGAVASGNIPRETVLYVAQVMRGAGGATGAGGRGGGGGGRRRGGGGRAIAQSNPPGKGLIPLGSGLTIFGRGSVLSTSAPARGGGLAILARRSGGLVPLQAAGTPGALTILGRDQEEISKPSRFRGTPASPAIDVDIPTDEPIDPKVGQVVKMAYKYLGVPYKWGGASPKTGFDCSGFVQWLYAAIGIDLPRTTWGQMKVGRPVSRDELQPGDLVFFGNGGHEGLYIGSGQFIHAPRTGDVVKISSLRDPWYSSRFLTARRVLL